mgnify:CR=1 FL=1
MGIIDKPVAALKRHTTKLKFERSGAPEKPQKNEVDLCPKQMDLKEKHNGNKDFRF